jgi:hypothetical protein
VSVSADGYQRRLRYFSVMPTFYQNDLDKRDTADVTDGSPSPSDRSLSLASSVNPFLDIIMASLPLFDGLKTRGDMVLFSSVPVTKQDETD